jgi:outer membrane receptor for ferrienterochelin and colicins
MIRIIAPAAAQRLVVVAALLAAFASTPQAQAVPPRPDSVKTDSVRALRAAVISATRAERRVEDTPIRVEVVDEEEIAEKTAMTPGDITMMLNETPGLRVQTTSPSLGGAGVRVQGLRGRYTLLLADGLPLYGESSGGLGLLQIPPIDLARAEIIKGTASALYGPSALGGVINLVSRRPSDERETELLFNQTSRNGTDAVLFASRPFAAKGWGGTLLTSAHRQSRSDIDNDGWTDLPSFERVVVRPRLFYEDLGRRSLLVTGGVTIEERAGGTMPGRLAPDGLAFAEGLGTVRADAGATARSWSVRGDVLAARASVSDQRHRHRIGTVLERDEHRTLFAEVTRTMPRGASTWVAGASFDLSDYSNRAANGFSYTYATPALFAQADRDLNSWLIVSANARVDAHSEYGTAFNPRVSLLARPASGALSGWTARLSVGRGTFAPGPITEETEVSGLSSLRPLTGLVPERAVGASADVGGLLNLSDEKRLEFNLAAFANTVADAVHAVDETATTPTGAQFFRLVNAPLESRTYGGEVLARLVAGDARITASYSFTGATEWDAASATSQTRVDSPLIPRHAAGLVATIEREDSGRAGLELYYIGKQQLDDDPYRTESRSHLVIGVLVEKIIGRARWFVNAENLLDERQTRYDSLVLPSRGRGGRWTNDVWAPLDGRTVNAGVRFGL